MARKGLFHKQNRITIGATVATDSDKALVKLFKQVCRQQGISTQQGLLRACRAYLSDLGLGK